VVEVCHQFPRNQHTEQGTVQKIGIDASGKNGLSRLCNLIYLRSYQNIDLLPHKHKNIASLLLTGRLDIFLYLVGPIRQQVGHKPA
jgi:hypothetical protein